MKKKVAIAGIVIAGVVSLGGYAVNSYTVERNEPKEAVTTAAELEGTGPSLDMEIVDDTIVTDDSGDETVPETSTGNGDETKGTEKSSDTVSATSSLVESANNSTGENKSAVAIKTTTNATSGSKASGTLSETASGSKKTETSSASTTTAASGSAAGTPSAAINSTSNVTESTVSTQNQTVNASSNTTDAVSNASSAVTSTETAQDNTAKTAVWHEPVYETQTVVVQVPKYKDVEITETRVRCVCNNCGAYLYTQEELDNHFSGKHTGGYHDEIYYVGTGEYETVGDGYEEQTVTEQVLVKEGYWSYE